MCFSVFMDQQPSALLGRGVRKPALIAIAILGVSPFGAAARESHTDRMVSSVDTTFLSKAAQDDLTNAVFGKLGAQKATNPKVKQFGQRMVDDQARINDQLHALVTNKGVALPTALDPERNAVKNHLATLTGVAFDRAYMKDMLKDQKHGLAAFRHEAGHGADPDVKAFASRMVPTLEEHVQLAEEALKQVRKKRL
jgi:putative membrane protein